MSKSCRFGSTATFQCYLKKGAENANDCSTFAHYRDILVCQSRVTGYRLSISFWAQNSVTLKTVITVSILKQQHYCYAIAQKYFFIMFFKIPVSAFRC